MGSAILLISCRGDKNAGANVQENILTMQSDTLTHIETKNGVLSFRFYTPLLEEYKFAPEPYTEFRRGVDLITYDTLGEVKSTLVANYAIFFQKRELWEARGDVKVTNRDGQVLETSQLFWNQLTGRVYSNVDTRITMGDDFLIGQGFESDQDFTEWVFRKPRGVFEVDVEPGRKDSTSVADPQGGGQGQDGETARPGTAGDAQGQHTVVPGTDTGVHSQDAAVPGMSGNTPGVKAVGGGDNRPDSALSGEATPPGKTEISHGLSGETTLPERAGMRRMTSGERTLPDGTGARRGINENEG